MSTNLSALYVGDLPVDMTEGELNEIFSTIGPVLSTHICCDAITRRPLGYGYVNYQRSADAKIALNKLNFALIKGRPIRIMWSQQDSSLRRSGVGNLYIRNLADNIDSKTLYDMFSVYGNVLSCKVATDENGESKGHGFIQFDTEQSADLAIKKVNGIIVRQRKVYVSKFVPRGMRLKPDPHKSTSFTNLYVRHLPNMTEERLIEVFSIYGHIISCVVMRNMQGISRGFGFVKFARADSAQAALDELHEMEIDGQILYVAQAQKKSVRQAELKRRYDDAQNDRFKRNHGTNLFLKNLDTDVNDDTLYEVFGKFGTIISARVMIENGCSKGFGFVCYSTEKEAKLAITEMHGKIFGTKPLYIALAQRRDERKAFLATHLERVHRELNVPQSRSAVSSVASTSRQLTTNVMMQPTRWGSYPFCMRNDEGFPVYYDYSRACSYSPILNNCNNRLESPGQDISSPSITSTPIGSPQASNSLDRANSECSLVDTDEILSLEPHNQREVLSQKLSACIEKMCPNMGERITALLIPMHTDALIKILQDRKLMCEKIDEALCVLDMQQNQGKTNASTEFPQKSNP